MNYQIRTTRQARPTKSDSSKKTIYLRIFPMWDFKGKDFIISSRQTIDKNQWNNQKKLAKSMSIESQRFNTKLQKLEDQVSQLFDEYIKTNKTPDIKVFKQYIEYKLFGKGEGINNTLDASKLLLRYLEQHGHKLGLPRKKRFLFVQQRVDEFNQMRFKTIKVELKHINREWYNGFQNFLMNRFKYQTDTLTGYLKVLRSAVRDAYLDNYIERYPFEGCKLQKGEENMRYLTKYDLNKLINFRTNDARMQLVADCFVFATQTGLAFTDLKAVTKQMIFQEGNIPMIKKKRQKTDVECKIPLNPIALQIIQKYKTHQAIIGTDVLLPVIHLNDYNVLLKMIAIHCKINTKLSSHVARHTFATTVWMNHGDSSMETLQVILGHKDLRTTHRYGKVSGEKVAKVANKVFAQPCEDGGLHPDKLMSNAMMNAN